jgi:hypothetical protein
MALSLDYFSRFEVAKVVVKLGCDPATVSAEMILPLESSCRRVRGDEASSMGPASPTHGPSPADLRSVDSPAPRARRYGRYCGRRTGCASKGLGNNEEWSGGRSGRGACLGRFRSPRPARSGERETEGREGRGDRRGGPATTRLRRRLWHLSPRRTPDRDVLCSVLRLGNHGTALRCGVR